MMPLIVGDVAIDGDVVGDDDDGGGRGPLNWGTCKCRQCGCTPLYFCQIPPKFAKIYIFQYWILPCLDTVTDFLQ